LLFVETNGDIFVTLIVSEQHEHVRKWKSLNDLIRRFGDVQLTLKYYLELTF